MIHFLLLVCLLIGYHIEADADRIATLRVGDVLIIHMSSIRGIMYEPGVDVLYIERMSGLSTLSVNNVSPYQGKKAMDDWYLYMQIKSEEENQITRLEARIESLRLNLIKCLTEKTNSTLPELV